MSKLSVVAFGGNALLRAGQIGTADEQEQNAYDTCKNLLGMIKRGENIVITHGNGPQVGNIYLRSDAGYSMYKLPKMPLDISVADSQGEIGYMIERMMRNLLVEEGIQREIVTILTQVVVDKDDPAFNQPTKPVGPYYLKEEADLLSKTITSPTSVTLATFVLLLSHIIILSTACSGYILAFNTVGFAPTSVSIFVVFSRILVTGKLYHKALLA
jgi:carbamate kinase